MGATAVHPLVDNVVEQYKGSYNHDAGYLRPRKRALPDVFVSEKHLEDRLHLASELYLALEDCGYRVIAAALAHETVVTIFQDRKLHFELADRADVPAELKRAMDRLAWALWGAASAGIKLSAHAGELVSKINDDVVALLALDVESRMLLPNVDKSIWQADADDPAALRGEHWLLSYEGRRKGWLNCPALPADSLLNGMLKAGVSFYDPGLVKPHFPLRPMECPGERWRTPMTR